MQVISFQAEHNQPLKKFWQAKEFRAEDCTHWSEAPFLVTDAFKETDFPLITFPTSEISGKFLTSGTTQGRRGAHFHRCTQLYETSLWAGWNLEQLPTQNLYFLTPPPSETPESSLIHMFGTLNQHTKALTTTVANEDAFIINTAGEINWDTLDNALDKNEPLMLLGPALAHLSLMRQRPKLPLPPGSKLLETGGYKGSSISLSKTEFYEQLTQFYAIHTDRIVNEYGMTELSTPAYASNIHGRHRLPHWAKAITIDPVTGTPSKQNQPGYLCLFDLANLESVAAIRTQDYAITHPDGSFTLIGRDPKAIKRGCSLSSEELLLTSPST